MEKCIFLVENSGPFGDWEPDSLDPLRRLNKYVNGFESSWELPFAIYCSFPSRAMRKDTDQAVPAHERI
jgi:hypothetical protein